MSNLAEWLELHAAHLQQGLRRSVAYPLPPVMFSPPERELFQLAEQLADLLRPVEPRPAWVASLYERLMTEAARPRRIAPPARPALPWWWVGIALGAAALGVLACRRRYPGGSPGNRALSSSR